MLVNRKYYFRHQNVKHAKNAKIGKKARHILCYLYSYIYLETKTVKAYNAGKTTSIITSLNDLAKFLLSSFPLLF